MVIFNGFDLDWSAVDKTIENHHAIQNGKPSISMVHLYIAMFK
jgi:hypothetical protein